MPLTVISFFFESIEQNRIERFSPSSVVQGLKELSKMVENATVEQVWQMVQGLYTAKDETQRKLADNWLKEYQKSAAAWGTLDMLLKADGVAEEAQFFAANSIRSKINKGDLRQLDENGRETLKNSLMAHIYKFR